jgi:hypothetical protein
MSVCIFGSQDLLPDLILRVALPSGEGKQGDEEELFHWFQVGEVERT